MTAEDLLGPGSRRALVVATGHYRHDGLPDLASPTMDAHTARQVLGSPDLGRFDPEVLADPDSHQAMDTIYEFFASATSEEFLFAYFSGHGRKEANSGRLYIATVDTDPDRLPVTAIPTEFLREMADSSRARCVVLVLDCCYAGAFGGELRQRQHRERVVVLSASAVQRAHEGGKTPGEAAPSAFAGAFFEGIRTGIADTDDSGWITVREAFGYALARLRDLGVDQNPQMRAGISEDLVLSRAPIIPGRLPAEISKLVRSSLPAARRVAVDEMAGWLVSGDPARIEPAEQALGTLRSDPDERVAQAASRVLAQRYASHPEERPEPLPAPAERLREDPLWFKQAVFYEVRVRTFADSNGDGVGDLRGLIGKLDYLKWLGVGCVLLAPIYDSPLTDDGYDARDLKAVHPDLGRVADLIELIDAAHRRDIRVMLDLVLNHTSDQHPWFRESRADPDGPFGDFYVWSETADLFTATTEAADGQDHWTFDPVRKQYYWHRFAVCEPDLNYDCPGVQEAMLEVVSFWLELGVDGYRLVTAPYLYERDGTLSVGLTETHTYLRRMRTEVDKHYPGRVLIASADHWPADAGAYFGDAKTPECSMVLYASLVPRIFLAMLRQHHSPVSTVLARAASIPDDCQWGLFLRNGDEMSLDLVDENDRSYLLREYAPQQRMRTASGIRRRLATLLGGHRSQVEFCLGLLLSLPGSPVLYYGDEIGMGENLMLAGSAAIRTPMQWTSERAGGFSVAEQEELAVPVVLNAAYGYQARNVAAQSEQPASLLNAVRRLIDIRRNSPALMTGSFTQLASGNAAIFAYVRADEREQMLCVANFSRFPQAAAVELSGYEGRQPVEATGGARFPLVDAHPYPLSLSGHGFLWFRLSEALR